MSKRLDQFLPWILEDFADFLPWILVLPWILEDFTDFLPWILEDFVILH